MNAHVHLCIWEAVKQQQVKTKEATLGSMNWEKGNLSPPPFSDIDSIDVEIIQTRTLSYPCQF